MNKAVNTGYSATSASSYGPGPVMPPSNFIPQSSNPATNPMTPIDRSSDISKIIHSIDSGISGLGHPEDQGIRVAGLGYGVSKLGGPVGRLGGGLLRRLMPPAFDELIPAVEAGIELAPLAILYYIFSYINICNVRTETQLIYG